MNSACIHCGNLVYQKDAQFCCLGCETVFKILEQSGLKRFYQIKEHCPVFAKENPVSIVDPSKFDYLKAYQKTNKLEFYLDNIHCGACVWLLEKLPELEENVVSVRVNLTDSTAVIEKKEIGCFSQIAQRLSQLGYPPHLIQDKAQARDRRLSENKKQLWRLAICLFATGNQMLLAWAIYTGANGSMGAFFNVLCIVLAVPILSYGAYPFYRSAFKSLLSSLQMKRVLFNIDVPIALALVLGTSFSIFRFLQVGEAVYLDSLCMLVSLLLASRYFLNRLQNSALNSLSLIPLYQTNIVRLIESESTLEKIIPISELKKGQRIQVYADECIPVDGIVDEGNSELDLSVLTGESHPQPISAGDEVWAGTKNLTRSLKVRVQEMGTQTRVGKILEKAKESVHRNASYVQIADRISQYFVFAILVLSLGTFLFFLSESLEVAISRSLALIIVSCPCALGLATPLAYARAMGIAAKKGIVIKSGVELEKILDVEKVVFDKTGTLTEGKFNQCVWEYFDEYKKKESHEQIHAAVLSLEVGVNHPIAHAIRDNLSRSGTLKSLSISEHQKIPGTGVKATIAGSLWYAGKSKERGSLEEPDESEEDLETKVYVYKNNTLVALIRLGDQIRKEAVSVIADLRSRKREIYLLSGDTASVSRRVAEKLQIRKANVFSQKSPEEKEAIIKEMKRAMMIGDGANDAAALSKAHVGVAVHGGMEASLEGASIFFSKPGIGNLSMLFRLAQGTRNTLWRNFAFSIGYNVLGALGAILGIVNPLVAAFLMPISAFTVFISSLILRTES